jgi:hypothetical protein
MNILQQGWMDEASTTSFAAASYGPTKSHHRQRRVLLVAERQLSPLTYLPPLSAHIRAAHGQYFLCCCH